MTTHRRRIGDVSDNWRSERGGGSSAGSFILATALGIGIGLLAAPQPGAKTRQRLRKRISALSEDLGDRWGEAQELSGRARARVRDRWGELRKRGRAALDELEDRLEDYEEESEEEDSGIFGTLLAIATGVAATYFLTSERAAPARSKVREAAQTVRQKASDRWERYQEESRSNGQPSAGTSRSETEGGFYPSEEAPQAS